MLSIEPLTLGSFRLTALGPVPARGRNPNKVLALPNALELRLIEPQLVGPALIEEDLACRPEAVVGVRLACESVSDSDSRKKAGAHEQLELAVDSAVKINHP